MLDDARQDGYRDPDRFERQGRGGVDAKRVFVLAVVGVLVVGLAVASAVLTGGNGDALRAKQGVAPSLALPSGGFASSSATGRKAGAKTSDAAISWFTVSKPSSLDIDLRDLPAVPNNPLPSLPEFEQAQTEKQATELGSPAPHLPSGLNAPTAGTNFAGLGFSTAVTGGQAGAGWPPDTNGDVGPTYFIQAVNTVDRHLQQDRRRRASRRSRSTRSGPAPGRAPRATTTTATRRHCTTRSADRWFVADFAFTGTGSTAAVLRVHRRLARRATPSRAAGTSTPIRADDASHPWFPDYPKMGIWPDGLYMTANMFEGNQRFQRGSRLGVQPRTTWRRASPSRSVVVDTNTHDVLQPPAEQHAHARGRAAGRAAEPLRRASRRPRSRFEVFKFHVDYVGQRLDLHRPDERQPDELHGRRRDRAEPGQPLDSLRERLMMQAQYSNIGGTESLWVNHTVRLLRRAERRPASSGRRSTSPAATSPRPPVQQQIYRHVGATGCTAGWAASPSTSSATWRSATASRARRSTPTSATPAGSSATRSARCRRPRRRCCRASRAARSRNCGGGDVHRWGDYSAMTLDPDGCNFWYTTEYYAANGTTGRRGSAT